MGERVSEGTRRDDLEVSSLRMAGKTNLLLDVTLRNPFICAGRSGHTQGQLTATLTTQIKSSRAPLLTRSATIVTHINAIGRWDDMCSSCGTAWRPHHRATPCSCPSRWSSARARRAAGGLQPTARPQGR